MEKKEPDSFTVKDRRRFVVDASGDAQSEGDTTASEKPSPQEPHRDDGGAAGDQPREASSRQEQRAPLPEIDFATFVLSLSSNAFFHLGLIENPMTGKIERNLPLARQTIDIITLLQEKTKGNLTQDESNLIDNLLADLRLKYVNEAKK